RLAGQVDDLVVGVERDVVVHLLDHLDRVVRGLLVVERALGELALALVLGPHAVGRVDPPRDEVDHVGGKFRQRDDPDHFFMPFGFLAALAGFFGGGFAAFFAGDAFFAAGFFAGGGAFLTGAAFAGAGLTGAGAGAAASSSSPASSSSAAGLAAAAAGAASASPSSSKPGSYA